MSDIEQQRMMLELTVLNQALGDALADIKASRKEARELRQQIIELMRETRDQEREINTLLKKEQALLKELLAIKTALKERGIRL